MTAPPANRSYVLTPPGTGAIGVIRIIGPQAVSIVQSLFHASQDGAGSRLLPASGARLHYGHVLDGDETIDDVLVSIVSEEGATAVDITANGGVRVLERILSVLERLGAPVATAEESVSAAWWSRTLIQRELIEALAHARTERAVRFLARQRQTLLPRLQDIARFCGSDWERARLELTTLLAGYPAARVLLEGATVAIIGPPNSGKSTLFNRLLGRPAALVSSRAGTTRDWVAEPVEIHGVPITLVDTAGSHGRAGDLERQAIEAGTRIVRNADLTILLVDGSVPLSAEEIETIRDTASLFPRGIIAINKSDEGIAWDEDYLRRCTGLEQAPVRLSAMSGSGVDRIGKQVLESLGIREQRKDTVPVLFTARQAALAKELLCWNGFPPPSASWIEQHLIGRIDSPR